VNALSTAGLNITISANDFERGFSVNGSQIQIGLHNPGSVSVPEAGSFVDGAAQTTFSGSWIDRSAVTPGSDTGKRDDLLH
jgi:hypothetical protein